VTFVTIGELTQWTRLRHWGPGNRATLDTWLSDKPVIPAARCIAVIWGELSAAATQRGRPRPVSDSWVAACCLADDLPLATLSVKDFAGFAEHDGLVLIAR
jgi:toxin FitB